MSLLKGEIVQVMQRSNPGINPVIEEWKKNEITSFQEDLRVRVNAHISEKWFYTHIKAINDNLPRIDMLNLLSKYCGYKDWNEFTFRHQTQAPLNISYRTSNRHFILVPIIAAILMSILFGIYKFFDTQEYTFSFKDPYTNNIIKDTSAEVMILQPEESPTTLKFHKEGTVNIRTNQSVIRMVVKVPYYFTDTITRIVRKLNNRETITLRPDDFSLMIHYFSTTKVEDWKNRRKQLEGLIDNDAIICQVVKDDTTRGMALFNKDEFIDRLTIPSGSLKNLEVLGAKEKDGKIIFLRFRINRKKP